MIILEQNNLNLVVTRLNKNLIYENPYFIFEFINDMSKNVFYCNPNDFSEYEKYNKFIIECFSDSNDINSGDTIMNSGVTLFIENSSGIYNIYESEILTTEIENAHFLETGRYFVKSEDYTIFSTQNNEKTFYDSE
jgi:hypothetical protein